MCRIAIDEESIQGPPAVGKGCTKPWEGKPVTYDGELTFSPGLGPTSALWSIKDASLSAATSPTAAASVRISASSMGLANPPAASGVTGCIWPRAAAARNDCFLQAAWRTTLQRPCCS